MGPAKNIAVKQVNRPTDTTAIWLSLPYCHTTWAFLVTWSVSSSHRSWNAGSARVSWSLGLESLAGLLGMTPPLKVCWPPCEFILSGNLQKVAAIMNTQMRRARILNRMTPTGEATKLVLCGRESTALIQILVFLQFVGNNEVWYEDKSIKTSSLEYYQPLKRPCLIPSSVEVDGLKVLFEVVGSDIWCSTPLLSDMACIACKSAPGGACRLLSPHRSSPAKKKKHC